MNIPTHLITNTVIAVPLRQYFEWDWGIVIIFISAGVLIDIDHPLFFFLKYKTVNPKEWARIGKKFRQKMKPNLYILHSPEFNLALLVLSLYNPIFFVLLLSNLIHISLDIIDHYRYHRSFSWIKSWSLIYTLGKT